MSTSPVASESSSDIELTEINVKPAQHPPGAAAVSAVAAPAIAAVVLVNEQHALEPIKEAQRNLLQQYEQFRAESNRLKADIARLSTINFEDDNVDPESAVSQFFALRDRLEFLRNKELDLGIEMVRIESLGNEVQADAEIQRNERLIDSRSTKMELSIQKRRTEFSELSRTLGLDEPAAEDQEEYAAIPIPAAPASSINTSGHAAPAA